MKDAAETPPGRTGRRRRCRQPRSADAAAIAGKGGRSRPAAVRRAARWVEPGRPARRSPVAHRSGRPIERKGRSRRGFPTRLPPRSGVEVRFSRPTKDASSGPTVAAATTGGKSVRFSPTATAGMGRFDRTGRTIVSTHFRRRCVLASLRSASCCERATRIRGSGRFARVVAGAPVISRRPLTAC